ncbi:18856_t:CDS:2 [Gigaspora margarita]|uniref:18856_t:CDS:1 n=1 Tax=Gigaspora margarita TaxID=4874 RepID=A0ABN7UY71_GIGMA|nr:18856_t:CDS:2 [Gigaspora margarita]
MQELNTSLTELKHHLILNYMMKQKEQRKRENVPVGSEKVVDDKSEVVLDRKDLN